MQKVGVRPMERRRIARQSRFRWQKYDAGKRDLCPNVLLAVVISAALWSTGCFAGATFEATGAQQKAVCRRMLAAIDALPKSTLLEDWPRLIRMRGLSRPHWTPEAPLQHLDVIRLDYAYSGPTQPYPPGSKGDPAIWPRVEKNVLRSIREGSIKLESATVKWDGAGTTTKLYRLSAPGFSAGTLGKANPDHQKITAWRFIIVNTEEAPGLHNYPLYPSVYGDLLTIDGVAYFALQPDGQLDRFDLNSADGVQPAAPGIIPVCDFELITRSMR